jgi:RING-box protein 2
MADDSDGVDRGDPESQKSDKMFTLKKWNAVAMWSWDVECDTCAICRVQVMGKCCTVISCVCFEVMVVRLEVIPAVLLKIQIVSVLTLCRLASVSRLLSSGCNDPRRRFCTLLCYKVSTSYFHSYRY